MQTHASILEAQIDNEECRRRASQEQIRAEGEQYSCVEDNETTAWLQFTKWPQILCNRPLDIITATTRQPTRIRREDDQLLLGDWKGEKLFSSTSTERHLRLLTRGVDDMFNRAEETLLHTPYTSRCWITTYSKDKFQHKPLKLLPHITRNKYKASWKRFICYIFRALALGSSKRFEIYGLPLRKDDVTMMRFIIKLATELEEQQEDEDENPFLDVCPEDYYSNSGENDDDYASESESNSDSEEDVHDIENPNSESYEENGLSDCGDGAFTVNGFDHDHLDERTKNCPNLGDGFQLQSGRRLELSEALFQLSMMFWTYQSSSGCQFSSTLIHFVAALGVHPKSLAYRDAYHSTPILAGLVWVGRLLFVEYSVPLHEYNTLKYQWPARHKYNSQPERLESIRTKYMLRGCYSPLSEIIEMKAMGRHILRREGVPGNLMWAEDGQSFTIGNNKVIRLFDFCSVYRLSITRLQEQVETLMLGWRPHIDMSQISDDLSCRVPGWCFLSKKENNLGQTYQAMARRAWNSSFNGIRLAKAGHWMPGPCQDYLESGIRCIMAAFHAIHITSSLPARGSEINSIRLTNTKLIMRNIFIRDGKLMIVISYNKSRASNNYSFYVVRYLRADVASAIFLYISYIRPFMNFLANQLELPQYHCNGFLFPDPKLKQKHLNSSQITTSLQDLTRHLQTPWTISLYRQASLAIAKRFISEAIKLQNFYQPLDANTPMRMIAAGVGHHPRMLLTTYAIDKALPPRMQPELLEMYLRLCTIWQDWNQEYYENYCVSKAEENTQRVNEVHAPRKRAQSSSIGTTRQKRKRLIDLSAKHNGLSSIEIKKMDAPEGFIYNAQYKIAICLACESMLQTGGKRSFYCHLNRHGITGLACKAYIQHLSSLDLCPFNELRIPQQPIQAIQGLHIHAAFKCEVCSYFTTRKISGLDHLSIHKLGISPAEAWERGILRSCFVQTFSSAKGSNPFAKLALRHGKTASQHQPNGIRLWQVVLLQTYFTAKGKIDYFVVVEDDNASNQSLITPTRPLLEGEYHGPRPCSADQELLDSLKKDLKQASRDVDEKAAKVEIISEARGDRKRWLVQLGFAPHLHGLRDAEIWTSYKLPKKRNMMSIVKASNTADGDLYAEKQTSEEEKLETILGAVDILLRKAYDLVADRSLERKMTRQRAQQLSNFASGSGKKGRDIAFRCFKNESTLTSYFRKIKELLVFYYRVVYKEDGHFTRETDEQTIPQDLVDKNDEQIQAMDEMFEALQATGGDSVRGSSNGGSSKMENDGGNQRLERAIRKFYMRLICHNVGSAHFRSPVLSFCAMLSRTSAYGGRVGIGTMSGSRKVNGDEEEELLDDAVRDRRRLGGWHDPGNFNSHLSALIWTAQLMMFETVCYRHKDDESQIPDTLGTLCESYMHQSQETSFGHILQWRLYLSSVARSAISRKQARWSWDGLEITYLSTSLRIGHVSQLIVSEYKHARELLFNELLFGAADIATPEVAALVDDLDAEDYGGSWLTDKRNEEALRGTSHELLSRIERRAELRQIFIREATHKNSRKGHSLPTHRTLDEQAMALYEVYVQEFLKVLLTLLHISPMPPLRAPEILSITYMNSSSRRRSILLWERMVMLHVSYHKSQEQTDKDGDNIRFLPPAIAELLMIFLAFVQPMRLLFLRQAVPGGLLSPYLFSRLDGTVWPDEIVSKCLSRACTRAQVPAFKVAWWRQAAASITKEKFSAAERANFNLDELEAPEQVEEEDLLVDLAEGSNHSFRTFNQAYAGSTTLTMNTLLHRAFRASSSWRTFFRVDELLAEEEAQWRDQTNTRTVTTSPLSSYRKAKPRTRPLLNEKELVKVARGLYNNSTLQFRHPGQREAILATMGRDASEQVVVVLSTGSGKTLIVMVGAALEGAGTTILVLPTVALRSNMLERLTIIGLKWIIWSPGETRSAPIVIVSAETACKMSFLEYARKLEKGNLLDRIIVDECHLTLTASYRKSMQKLGSFVRQVRTQTVWLTATLPPSIEANFIKHNMLLRPCIIRESTNRRNIRYSIQRYKGPIGLARRAVEVARGLEAKIQSAAAGNINLPGGEKARVILYCQTVDMMEEIAEELDCPMYTGDQSIMSEADKEAALQRWLGPVGSNVLVATSAFSVGFDYAHVRWVVHVGPPYRMSDMAQESGRAGRDGMPCESMIMISDTWQPYLPGKWPNDDDEESMQLYLTGQHCCRAVMSQYLDAREDWRWCMKDEDELCMVCPAHHTTKRPSDMVLKLPFPQGGDDELEMDADTIRENVSDRVGSGIGANMAYTGPQTVLQQRMIDDDLIDRFVLGLRAMSGCCLLCRIKDKSQPFNHAPDGCKNKWGWIHAKKRVLDTCQKQGREWMADYTACFMCYLPQNICERARVEATMENSQAVICEFRDMILPICFGAFYAVGPRAFIGNYSGRRFRDEADYMVWLGSTTSFAGSPCTHAAKLAALLLLEFIN